MGSQLGRRFPIAVAAFIPTSVRSKTANSEEADINYSGALMLRGRRNRSLAEGQNHRAVVATVGSKGKERFRAHWQHVVLHLVLGCRQTSSGVGHVFDEGFIFPLVYPSAVYMCTTLYQEY